MSMTTRRWRKSCGRFPPFRRTGDHRPPEAEAAGVLPDGRLRAFRPQGIRVGAGGCHGRAAVEGEERVTVVKAVCECGVCECVGVWENRP